MNIIKSTSNPSGAYPPVQVWSGDNPPEGYMEITCDITEFYNGFVTLTVTDGKVTTITENVEAHKAWLAEEAAKPKPEPTVTLEAQIVALTAQLSATQSALDDLILNTSI